MKIASSTLLALCLLTWNLGCCGTRHARCVDWNGGGCQHTEPCCKKGGGMGKEISRFTRPKYKRHGEACTCGHAGCEMAMSPGVASGGCCESAPMPVEGAMMGPGCCGGREPAMMGGSMPINPIPESAGCAGCAGGQVMMAPPAGATGGCAGCGTPTPTAPPQVPATGWNASGSIGTSISQSGRSGVPGCATGNCQSQVIGDGIIYDNVTTPAPVPMSNLPVTSAGTAFPSAPPPPLPAGN